MPLIGHLIKLTQIIVLVSKDSTRDVNFGFHLSQVYQVSLSVSRASGLGSRVKQGPRISGLGSHLKDHGSRVPGLTHEMGPGSRVLGLTSTVPGLTCMMSSGSWVSGPTNGFESPVPLFGYAIEFNTEQAGNIKSP